MNNYILISVENNINRFINKCNKYNIELFNIKYINKNKIIVKINENDFENIKVYNYYSEINIYKRLGLLGLKEKIINLKYFFIVFLICLISMYLSSNIILKINVIHSNKRIRELVKEELYSYGIKKYNYKKNFNELEDIKNKILDNNKDKLEWLSITNVGMTYVIRVEERIITNIKEKYEYCNIISKSESLITNIYSESGEILVNTNDIVKKDDILISGNIMLNEESKGYTCASGIIKGKVWYNTNININRNYIKRKYTGKRRFNFTFKNKILRSNKYTNYEKKYLINTKLFTLYKELEFINKEYSYSEKEGIDKALNEVVDKFNTKLGKNGEVIETKIINKNISKDKINVDVFVVTEEVISKQVKLDINENNIVNN